MSRVETQELGRLHPAYTCSTRPSLGEAWGNSGGPPPTWRSQVSQTDQWYHKLPSEALVSQCDSSHTWQIQVTKECLAAGSFSWSLTRPTLSEPLSVSVLHPGMFHQQCVMHVLAMHHASVCNAPHKCLQGQLPCGDGLQGKSLSGSQGSLRSC